MYFSENHLNSYTSSQLTDSSDKQVTLLQLLNRVIDQDESALAELYDQCVDQVYHVAFAILKNEADSEEVVCDVFEYVWRKASLYVAEKSKVTSWLLMICRSKSIDLIRKRKPCQSLSDEQDLLNLEDDDLQPDELMNQFQQNSSIHKQLGTLSDVQRQVISLAYFKDLSHQEIATSLDLPLGTVKSHIRRATSALQSVICKDD